MAEPIVDHCHHPGTPPAGRLPQIAHLLVSESDALRLRPDPDFPGPFPAIIALPPELKLRIFEGLLEFSSIAGLSQSCKDFYEVWRCHHSTISLTFLKRTIMCYEDARYLFECQMYIVARSSRRPRLLPLDTAFFPPILIRGALDDASYIYTHKRLAYMQINAHRIATATDLAPAFFRPRPSTSLVQKECSVHSGDFGALQHTRLAHAQYQIRVATMFHVYLRIPRRIPRNPCTAVLVLVVATLLHFLDDQARQSNSGMFLGMTGASNSMYGGSKIGAGKMWSAIMLHPLHGGVIRFSSVMTLFPRRRGGCIDHRLIGGAEDEDIGRDEENCTLNSRIIFAEKGRFPGEELW